MEPQLAIDENIAVLPPLTGVPESPVRTRESIDPQITTSVHAIDPQSAQYSCEVTVANVADEDFLVVDVEPRLPEGLEVNEAVDSSEVELGKKHEEICIAVSSTLTNEVLYRDSAVNIYNAKRVREELRQALRPKNLFELYFYLIIGRMPRWLKAARERYFKIDVACAADAEVALKKLDLPVDAPARIIIESYIDRLRRIEKHEDFDCNGAREVLLKKGQQYKAVYVIGATRGKFSSNSYSLSFDIGLRRGDYYLARVAYATLTVPTGHLWTSLVAMASALAGALIQAFGPASSDAGTAPQDSTLRAAVESGRLFDIVTALGVPLLTALIVYNIFDMTSLKDRVSSARDWRTAVFVGFLCGFLNVKILHALGTLLG